MAKCNPSEPQPAHQTTLSRAKPDAGEKSKTVTDQCMRGTRWTNWQAQNEAKKIDRKLLRGNLFTLRIIN